MYFEFKLDLYSASLQCSMQNHIILNCIMMASDCILPMWKAIDVYTHHCFLDTTTVLLPECTEI